MAAGKLVAELIKEAVKESLPFPLSTVLIYLVNEVSEDHNSLSRLEQRIDGVNRKIDQHIIAPYKTGMVYLEEAQHASSRSSQQRYLRDAQKEFITAAQIELPQYPVLPIKAHFYVGVCHDLMADKRNALRWYEKAHGLIVSYLRSQDQDPERLELERERRISDLEKEYETLTRPSLPEIRDRRALALREVSLELSRSRRPLMRGGKSQRLKGLEQGDLARAKEILEEREKRQEQPAWLKSDLYVFRRSFEERERELAWVKKILAEHEEQLALRRERSGRKGPEQTSSQRLDLLSMDHFLLGLQKREEEELVSLRKKLKKELAVLATEKKKRGDWILKKLRELENSPGSLYDLLDPGNFYSQSRRENFVILTEQEYFLDWEIDRQEAEDISAWAIDLTDLIASRS